MYTCPECGQLADMNNNACEHCGAEVKICPECGTALDASAEICDFCGISLDASKNIVSSIATAPTVAPVQEEKTEPSNMEKLEEQEQKLAHYAEDCIKPFIAICKAFFTSSTISFVVGLLSSIFLSITSKSISLIIANLFFILAFILAVVGEYLNLFSPAFSASKVVNKVKSDNFDYVAYYKELKIYKREKGGSMIEAKRGEKSELLYSMPLSSIRLVKAIFIKEKPSSIVPLIIATIISSSFYSTAFILVLISFNLSFPNIEVFNNPIYWIAFLIFIIGATIVASVGNSNKGVKNWIYDIKESN